MRTPAWIRRDRKKLGTEAAPKPSCRTRLTALRLRSPHHAMEWLNMIELSDLGLLHELTVAKRVVMSYSPLDILDG